MAVENVNQIALSSEDLSKLTKFFELLILIDSKNRKEVDSCKSKRLAEEYQEKELTTS